MLWWLARALGPLISPSWLMRWRVAAVRHRYKLHSTMLTSADERILIDLTVIARRDVRTGIQRVVRSTFTQMLRQSAGCNIQSVRYNAGAFRHSLWPDLDAAKGEVVAFQAGDVFLGLDLSLDGIRRDMRRLLRAKRDGVRFWFVVYDLLPLQIPRYFSAKLVTRFRWWLIATAKLADGYACISEQTAEDLRAELALICPDPTEISIAVIPMGFEIVPSRDNRKRPFPFLLDDIVIAVGTLEPRKGYDDLLDAFELLWADNCATTLVIVGAPGWKTARLQRRVRSHPELGRRLQWMAKLDDHGLAMLYSNARGLVATSYGEGYGLPVLEAVAHGCPVLARDISAFRANAKHGLRIFPQHADPAYLADSIRDMLREGVRTSRMEAAVNLPTWQDTAGAVMALISAKRE